MIRRRQAAIFRHVFWSAYAIMEKHHSLEKERQKSRADY